MDFERTLDVLASGFRFIYFVMLQLEKEFQNNYFSKLKIKGDSENVRKKTSYSRTESNDSQRVA